MSIESFDLLLSKIKSNIEKQDTNMREAISVKYRLLITLRYLATGETFQSLSYSFRVSTSAISKIIPETIRFIYFGLKDDFLKCPSTKSEWLQVAEDFSKLWNFPFCLGALDGKHVAFRPNRADGSFYYNYKGFNSIILLALVDANYRFLVVDVGCNGRAHDASVFSDLELFQKAILSNSLDLPDDGFLPGTTDLVSYTFLGDEAFPLSTRLMRPFSQRSTIQEKIFNYRLSRGRRVVENAFGILSNRFKILQTEINLRVEKVDLIVLTCCTLHNFLIQLKDELIIEENLPDDNNFTSNTCLTGTGLQTNSANRSARASLEMRQKFKSKKINQISLSTNKIHSIKLIRAYVLYRIACKC